MNTSSSQKNLLGYALEFFLLFLAVTLGFFAENYRESQVERKTERMYLESLLEDLGQDTVKIDFSIQSKLTKDAYFDTLHQIIYQTPKPWPTRKLYFLSRYLVIREPFYGTEGTIKQLENSGGFKLIQNQTLVEQIQIVRDMNSIPFKEAIGKVFYGKELAFLFDPIKFKGRPYSLGEPSYDPPLRGTDQDLEDYFFWASNDILIERNTRTMLEILRASAKDLIYELEKEIQNTGS